MDGWMLLQQETNVLSSFAILSEPEWQMSLITLYDCELSSFKVLPMSPAVCSCLSCPVLFVTRVPFKLLTVLFKPPSFFATKKVQFPCWYYVEQHNASLLPEWHGVNAGGLVRVSQRNGSGSRAQRTLNMVSAFTVFGLSKTFLCIRI